MNRVTPIALALWLAAAGAIAAPLAEEAPGRSCDALAAFDDRPDLRRPVRLGDLDAPAAIAACSAALAGADGRPRHRLGLARGLIKAGRTREAVVQLAIAGKEGHAPSLFVLGQLYHAGRGVERDHGEAHALYVRAFTGGYPKAAVGILMLYEDPASLLYDPAKAAATRAALSPTTD